MSLKFMESLESDENDEDSPKNIFPDDIDDDMTEKARRSTACETGMKKWVAVKIWFPGVCFAMSMSLACIMEGYGLVLIAGFFASTQFKTHFGCPKSSDLVGNCEIPAQWQTALIDGALGGQVIGIVLNGWFTERYGYRKTFLGALSALTLFISITFFAPNLEVLLAGFILCGIPWGIFQTLTTSYASDVCPTPIRAYFTMWTNLCWVLGQLMGAVMQRILVNNLTGLSFRLPLGLQWAFPLPIFIAAVLAPESPWWLVRQGRTYDAYKAMTKLTNMRQAPADYVILNHIASLYVTNKTEENEEIKAGSKVGYIDCFKGVNRRRTTNCCLIWAMQNACGAALMQFSTYFFLQAGLGAEWAFTFTLIQVSTTINLSLRHSRVLTNLSTPLESLARSPAGD
jgi:MFS transporter, SP family, general alpha glucoside:H+ symporter